MKKIFLLAFPLLVAACNQAPAPLGIPYTEALKKCEPVVTEGRTIFDAACLNGAALPAFSAADMAGKAYSDQDLKGKWYLLNFWFVECKPCIEELPDLVGLSQRWGSDRFEIIGICRNDREKVAEFLQKTPLPYTIFPDSESLADEVFQNPFGYPASFLVDENGIIVDTYDALKEGNADYQALVKAVESAGK
jgi:peroxiredoxin